jgi:hypothetical protein
MITGSGLVPSFRQICFMAAGLTIPSIMIERLTATQCSSNYEINPRLWISLSLIAIQWFFSIATHVLQRTSASRR